MSDFASPLVAVDDHSSADENPTGLLIYNLCMVVLEAQVESERADGCAWYASEVNQMITGTPSPPPILEDAECAEDEGKRDAKEAFAMNSHVQTSDVVDTIAESTSLHEKEDSMQGDIVLSLA